MDTTVKKEILIKKVSGEEEIFSGDKLARSLLNAGAENETVVKIVADIEKWLSPGMSTKEVYSRAFAMLSNADKPTSLRYRLKQAILELGPTGFPFETLIGILFQQMGYETEVGVVLQGKCITHEIDVVATNNKVQHFVECKYHKDQGKHVNIQVPLYVRSRMDDIISVRKQMNQYRKFDFKAWVITNTRLSNDSIKYGTCNDLNLLAWNYPVNNGLKHLIEKYKLYPITILKELTVEDKQLLLNKGIVSCLQLLENTSCLNDVKNENKDALLNEINEMYKQKQNS